MGRGMVVEVRVEVMVMVGVMVIVMVRIVAMVMVVEGRIEVLATCLGKRRLGIAK